MNSRATLSANITRLMDERGLSRAQLAKASGVAKTMIGNIIRQENSPRVELVENLARGLRVPLWVLLAPPDMEGASEVLRSFASLSAVNRRAVLQVARSLGVGQSQLAET